MPGSRRALIILATAVTAAAFSAGTAFADDSPTPPPQSPREGPRGTLSIQLSSTTSTPHTQGGGGNTGVTFTGPPCGYMPLGDSTAFLKELQNMIFLEHHTDFNGQDWPDFQTWIKGYEDQFTAHENDKPQGVWYSSFCSDYSNPASNAWIAANPDYVYVPPAGPAPNIPRVDPKLLAQYALASTILPTQAPTFAPAAGQPSVVNLSTWAWQPDGKVLDLTATLGPQAATVVMTPASMALTADGPTTAGVPSTCQRAAGIIGVPYTAGQNNPTAPGCGLEFSAQGAYNVTADIDWQITWTSPQVVGVQTMPDIHMRTTTPLTAQEIQTINGTPTAGN
jgi:hypothetical protein